MTGSGVLVGCDGSCLRNPGGPTGWAWVAEDGRWASGGQQTGTNQVAELWGVLSVLRDFPDVPVTVQLDSEYSLNVATKWRLGWAKNGWRTRKGDQVLNLALVRAIDLLLTQREHPASFVHVPGHDAQNRWPLNTAADRCAQDAARAAASDGPVQRSGTSGYLVSAPSAILGPALDTTQRCSSCDAVMGFDGSCRCSL